MKENRSTGIEWTEHTWNPFVGCSIHSAGCTNCYAMRTAMRLQEFHMASYQGVAKLANGSPVWTGRVNRASETQMRKPFKIGKPSLIFVNSMSDFFHEAAHDSWRWEALEIMRDTPHQYQVLTKRPENIQGFLDRTISHYGGGHAGVSRGRMPGIPDNVWIGATVERDDFKHRVETLRKVPAKIKFLSVEPLIGPMGPLWLEGIDWVIAGGESGPGARPMEADWVRRVRNDCIAQDVPFFFKQFGKAQNNPLYAEAPKGVTGSMWVEQNDPVGKGGSKLDGREWKEYPKWT